MVTYATDPEAVMRLGADITAMAHDVGRATSAVSGIATTGIGEMHLYMERMLAGPPETVSALSSFAAAYQQTTQRLHDDVVALGQLTQAVGAAYDEVEAAASSLYGADPEGSPYPTSPNPGDVSGPGIGDSHG